MNSTHKQVRYGNCLNGKALICLSLSPRGMQPKEVEINTDKTTKFLTRFQVIIVDRFVCEENISGSDISTYKEDLV